MLNIFKRKYRTQHTSEKTNNELFNVYIHYKNSPSHVSTLNSFITLLELKGINIKINGYDNHKTYPLNVFSFSFINDTYNKKIINDAHIQCYGYNFFHEDEINKSNILERKQKIKKIKNRI